MPRACAALDARFLRRAEESRELGAVCLTLQMLDCKLQRKILPWRSKNQRYRSWPWLNCEQHARNMDRISRTSGDNSSLTFAVLAIQHPQGSAEYNFQRDGHSASVTGEVSRAQAV